MGASGLNGSLLCQSKAISVMLGGFCSSKGLKLKKYFKLLISVSDNADATVFEAIDKRHTAIFGFVLLRKCSDKSS